MTDNYRTIEGKLARLEEFKGNSMSAITYSRGSIEIYEVYSYSTVVARVSTHTDGITYEVNRAVAISKNHWGNTSGRHINLCRRLLPGGADAVELEG